MGDEKDWTMGKTQQAVATPVKDKDAFEDTLPGAERPTKPLEEGDVLTSARVSTRHATANTSGSVSLSGLRVAEPLARELIVRRMSKASIALQADYVFSHGDLLVRLDGFDPTTKIGYQYISHADEDVVTDFSRPVENRLAELTEQGIVHVLVIHDHRAQDTTEVLAQVEAFLAGLGRS